MIAQRVDLVDEVGQDRTTAGARSPDDVVVGVRLFDGPQEGDSYQGTDGATLHQFPEPHYAGVIASVMADEDGNAGRGGIVDQSLPFVECGGDWFFYQRHDTAADACQGKLFVQVGGRGDDRAVGSGEIQGFQFIVEEWDLVLCRQFCNSSVRVADGNKLTFAACVHIVDVTAAHCACAQNGYTQLAHIVAPVTRFRPPHFS